MQRLNWLNTSFLAGTHFVALFGTTAYLLLHGLSWAAVGIAAFYLLACGFSMTAGYHRLFSHVSYTAHPALRAFFLVFGAAQFENSALKWSSDHRRHHAETDETGDPYNIRRGFWWAHVGWILFHSESPGSLDRYRDLAGDPLVTWQHRHYLPLAVTTCFVVPAAAGALLGDAWGGLLLAGFVRLVVLHHCTFCVNSVAHSIGSQPYSDRDSARDSFLAALLTLGEGYHNYHHRFPSDYRNGVRAWHFDPTKWAIRLLSLLGLTRRLKRVGDARVVRARVAMEARRAQRALGPGHPERAVALQSARDALERLIERWGDLKVRISELRVRGCRDARALRSELKREFKQVRGQLNEALRDWKYLLREHLAAASS